MNKTLQRQLRKTLGFADSATLAATLDRLRAENESPELRGLLGGLVEFLMRVDSTYDQYERDLALRTRSLELSSAELTTANTRLRDELADRDKALHSLRGALLELVPSASESQRFALTDGDLAILSRRIAELVEERERSRRILSNQKFALDQHAIVSITDIHGTIVYANDRFCEISGYDRNELIGANHRIVKSGVHPAEVFRQMWETISHGQVWHGQICNRARSGSLYWVNATIVPLLGPDGLPEQYIGIRTDITRTKEMEAELSEQLHLVEELIEAIPLPLYFKNTAGRYIRVNRAFELLIGTSREAILGQTIHAILSDEDAALHLTRDAELLASGGVQSYEATIHSRNGVRHDTLYRKVALTRRDGTVTGLLGAIIDITERKQAEQEILRAKEAAEAASQAKSDFLANMSHEIRTPMNGVIGMTELALDTALSEEQREYLSIVKSSAESLLTILNDILDFSKIEAGKLLVEQINFDLHRVVADTLKSLALRAHEKGLELVCDLGSEVPRHVLGDPSRLRQVLVNLIGNAIKFTERGEIAVQARLENADSAAAEVRFAVRDTGIGIAPEKQSLIFDAFAQEDSSTTRKYGGTGLGLSISRKLVELMGGHMRLDSQVGIGSIFSFTVRLQHDTAPQPSLPGFSELRGRRLLVVDDNATNRQVLEGMLHSWQMEAVSVASGAAALALVASDRHFDAILLDAHMPEMDGYELARRLHADWPTLPPMLMLSSGAMRGDARRCQEAGIVGFFSKPISGEELLAALHRIFALPAGEVSDPTHLVTRHSLREQEKALHLLLVEDHPVNQKLALGLLDKWGHHTTLAQHGQEAVDIVDKRHFDLILMDMQMPVMGGLEATRRIRAAEISAGRPRTPIIAMTAAAMESDREACLAAGMDDYIAKPIKATELQEKLLAVGGIANVRTPGGFDYADALRLADQETIDIITDIFLATWERDLDNLRRAMREEQRDASERIAHSLRGTLATFNAEPAADLAGDIEKRSHHENSAALLALADKLETEIRRLVACLVATA